MGGCVGLRGPGAGRKRAGLIKGLWKMAVGPCGSRSASGEDAKVHRAAGLRLLLKNPAGRVLDSCFCKASFVCNKKRSELLELKR